MSDHTLVVTLETLTPAEQAEYDAADIETRHGWDRDRIEAEVECSGLDHTCQTWWECMTPCEEARGTTDPLDYDEHLSHTGRAHGVEHQRIDGVWMTATGACLGVDLGNAAEAAYDTAVSGFNSMPGNYPVTITCEDASLIITPIKQPATA